MVPEMKDEMFVYALSEDSNWQKQGRILRIAVLNTQRIIDTDEYRTAAKAGETFDAWWLGFQAQTREDVLGGLADLSNVERAAFVMGGRYLQCLLAAGSGELR